VGLFDASFLDGTQMDDVGASFWLRIQRREILRTAYDCALECVCSDSLGPTRNTINRGVLEEYADFDPRAWTKAPTTSQIGKLSQDSVTVERLLNK
jgi:hypothetical protein